MILWCRRYCCNLLHQSHHVWHVPSLDTLLLGRRRRRLIKVQNCHTIYLHSFATRRYAHKLSFLSTHEGIPRDCLVSFYDKIIDNQVGIRKCTPEYMIEHFHTFKVRRKIGRESMHLERL